MPFISTRGQSPPVDLAEALLNGLAPDGGLFMPTNIPTLEREEIQELAEMTWVEMATFLAQRLMGPKPGSVAAYSLVSSALDFPLPLKMA